MRLIYSIFFVFTFLSCEAQLILPQSTLFYQSSQDLQVVQREAEAAATNTLAFTFTTTPNAGSLLLFCVRANGTGAATSAEPTGYGSLYEPAGQASAGPRFQVGYVIANGTTNSFTFTYASATEMTVFGYEIINWSNVVAQGFNFNSSATGVTVDGSVGTETYEAGTIGIAFVGMGSSVSNIAFNAGYTQLVTSDKGGSSERYNESTVTDNVIASWTTSTTVRSAVITVSPLQEEVSSSAEALAVITNIETGSGEELTLAEENAVTRFVNEQVQAGNWDEFHSFIPFSGLNTSAKARVDWMTGVQATLVGTPDYDPATGFTTNGTDNYIDTQVNPSTINGGSAVALDDVGYGIHIIDNPGTVRWGVIGTSANGQALLTMPNTGVSISRHHRSGNYAETNAQYMGLDDDFYFLWRVNSAGINIFKDMQNISTETGASSEVPAGRTIFIGAHNNNGTAASLSAGSYGTFAILKASTINRFAFQAHWEVLMMELGVKPKTVLYPVDLAGSGLSSSDAMIWNSEGQSNGAFCGSGTGGALTVTELTGPITGANVFWGGQDPSLPVSPVQIQTLDYEVNNSVTSNQLNNYAAGMRAAFEIADREDATFYIWHYDRGGSGLAASFTDDWYPDLTNKLFDRSNLTVGAEGMALVSEPIKKFVWQWSQGEGDANALRTEAEYFDDFMYMLHEKIEFLESEGMNFSATQFHVIVRKLYFAAPYGAGTTSIRDAQDTFTIANYEAEYPADAGKIQTMVVYDTDRLIYEGDEVHMSDNAYHIEGYRLGLYISKLPGFLGL